MYYYYTLMLLNTVIFFWYLASALVKKKLFLENKDKNEKRFILVTNQNKKSVRIFSYIHLLPRRNHFGQQFIKQNFRFQ